MVVTMRAVLIALLIRTHILPKRLLALLAHKHHLRRLGQPVRRLRFCVTFGTVEPLFATWRADGDLCV